MHVSFPRFILFIIAVFKRVVQLSMLVLVVNLLGYFTHKHFTESAQEQRNRLYTRFQALNAKINSLDGKISESYGNEDLLHAKFGLMAQDTSMREMGFGGPVPADSTLIWSAVPIKKLITSVSEKVKKTEIKIDRTNNSYLNLQRHMDNLYAKLQHTPSIMPTTGNISSHFGIREHPIIKQQKMHQGIDVSNSKWTPIRVSANGRVDKVADSETLGRYVSIDHGNGIITRYGHMEKPFAKEGQMVSRYDVIGYMGNTGRSVGPHLHYEVWVNGIPVNPVNYILSDRYSVD